MRDVTCRVLSTQLIFGIALATELLVYLSSGSVPSTIQRTLSHDLQSFCWVIIYTTFKHSIEEVKKMSTSAIRGIARFNNKTFRQEFDRLFTATSTTNLVDNRRTAFLMGSVAEDHRGKALACAGIENLHNYAASKDRALASHLKCIWHFLKKCQPLQTWGVDDELSAEDREMLEEKPAMRLPPRAPASNLANLRKPSNIAA